MPFCNLVNMRKLGESLTKDINNIVVRMSGFNYFNDS